MSEGGGGFTELVQQAGRLTSDMDTSCGDELPRVQRNLKQLLQAGQQLWARTAQTGAQDVKASILLGSKGVDLPSLSQRLQTLDPSRTFQPLQPVQDTDVAGFLRNERENAVLTVIEQSRKQTFDEVDQLHWAAFQSCWELEEQRILGSLSDADGHLLDVTIQPELSVSSAAAGGGGTAGVPSSLTALEKAYADTIGEYVDQLAQGRRPDLVARCRDLMEKHGDSVAVELWDTVCCMTQVDVAAGVDRSSIRHPLIEKAKRFLETSYLARLQRVVYSHLAAAGLGGEPGTLHLVRSYLAVQPAAAAADAALLRGQPVWAVVYHCLRCGDPAAARQALQGADGPELRSLSEVLAHLSAARDGRLGPGQSQTVLRLMQHARDGSGDPYIRAVCAALGAPDQAGDEPAEAHADLAASTDDYLWRRLSGLSVLGAERQARELATLQTQLAVKYGESHFDAYNQPSLMFRVLLLSQQPEAAVEFLARLERLRPHAVHVALALHQLSLLRLTESAAEPILSGSAPHFRLNLARLVLLYTRRFEAQEPRAALHYLFLLRHLRLDAGPGGGDLFPAAVCQLALQSGRYDELLGRMAPDGSRLPGAIDRYGFDAHPVIARVAEECEKRGELEDAVHLHDLADNHDKVLSLLNRLLSQVVASSGTENARRQRLQTLAVGIARRFKEHGHRASAEAAGTLYLLLDLMQFFDLVAARRADEALDVLARLRLVPLRQEDLQNRLLDFQRLQDEVRHCISDVLLAAMTLLHGSRRPGAAAPSDEARQSGRVLIAYAGSLQYRLRGDTHARLVQMEVLMN